MMSLQPCTQTAPMLWHSVMLLPNMNLNISLLLRSMSVKLLNVKLQCALLLLSISLCKTVFYF